MRINELQYYNEHIGDYPKEHQTKLSQYILVRLVDKFSEAGHSGSTAYMSFGVLENCLLSDDLAREEFRSKILNREPLEEGDSEELRWNRMENKFWANIREMLEIFDSIGNYATARLYLTLLMDEPILPLTDTPDDWEDDCDIVTIPNGKTYRHKRCFWVSKYVFDNGIEIAHTNYNTYSDNGGISFFTTGRLLEPVEIQFPYVMPKNRAKHFIYEWEDKDWDRTRCIYLTNPETIAKVKALHD